MRHIVTTLIFSLFLSLGTGVAFADRHNDRGHDRERKEQRFHGNHKDKKKDKGRHKDRHDKSHKGHKKITSMATCVPATMATNIMAGHHDRASMAPHMATARIIIMHRLPLCLQD